MTINLDSLNSENDGMNQILHYLQRMSDFLKQHDVLWRAHLVDFFQEKLWEKIDKEWYTSLEHCGVCELVQLPLGISQNGWPSSLRGFIETALSLSLSRKPNNVDNMAAKPPIESVLAQGMNAKKLHEVEILGALVALYAEKLKATDVVDVGAGQGYLAQVLSFQYGLPVTAIDCCSHHMDVTSLRAARIQKHYKSKVHKGENASNFLGPRTMTYHFGVAGKSSLLPLLESISLLETAGESEKSDKETVIDDSDSAKDPDNDLGNHEPSGKCQDERCIVLTGLHACGDLSANMLRTFLDCDKVDAVICVGCCYNLLSEGHNCGFPLSEGVKNAGVRLDNRGRDLACQSVEKWSNMRPEDAAQKFLVHSFRAAFQLVLERFLPEIAACNPCVGRLGKTRRRKEIRRGSLLMKSSNKLGDSSLQSDIEFTGTDKHGPRKCVERFEHGTTLEKTTGCRMQISSVSRSRPGTSRNDTVMVNLQGFQEYTKAALKRLNLPEVPEEKLLSIWEEVQPYTALVGVFWSLRAVLAPVLESYILLDRLLFLKEQASKMNDSCQMRITSQLVPLFDPMISPRNMAIVAMRCAKEIY